MGQGPGLSNRNLGEFFGQEAMSLAASQIPIHAHRQLATTNPASSAVGPGEAPAESTGTNSYGNGDASLTFAAAAVGATGGNQPHNNIAPYLTVTFVIATSGIFPSRN